MLASSGTTDSTARDVTVCLSFDLDWAADFIIDELSQRLAVANLPATVFCTHDSAAVRRLLSIDGVECALHPNFLGEDRDEGRVLRRLVETFAEARGVRCHALYYHSGLLAHLHRAGITHLSNDLSFLAADIDPHYDYSGMVRLPIFWEDDVHCVYFGSEDRSFSIETIAHQLALPGLKVFNFHPVHLYLNTRDLDHYRRYKAELRDPRRAAELRQAGPGTSSLFDALVAWARAGDIELATLGQVARRYVDQHSYDGHFGDSIGDSTGDPIAATDGRNRQR